MSAAVCGSKRSYFQEDLASPPVSKKLRCSPLSTSPIRLSSPSLLDQLQGLFPHTEPQFLEKVAEECGNDLHSTIKTLHGSCLGSEEHNSGSAKSGVNVEQGTLNNDGDSAASKHTTPRSNLPADGAQWVDMFVTEMISATSVDDAKARASMLLEFLEKSITTRAVEGTAQSFHKENVTLKDQIEVLIRENSILKRAVAIQHERQKELEVKNQELPHLKQLVFQYQEQLRILEVNNYALKMHLRQAQQSSSIPGSFHPDVF